MARPALTPVRIIDAAVVVADRDGLAAVSMRHVAAELGVEAMSLYHHVASKDAILDAMVERIYAAIELPAPDASWRPAMAERAASARDVLRAHPWGLGLIESRRNPGPATMRHHDAVLGCLRGNGFSVALAAHAFSLLDAYVYGFVLTELNLPFERTAGAEELVAETAFPADEFPHLAELIAVQVLGQEYDYADEFGVGLDLILDALGERLSRP